MTAQYNPFTQEWVTQTGNNQFAVSPTTSSQAMQIAPKPAGSSYTLTAADIAAAAPPEQYNPFTNEYVTFTANNNSSGQGVGALGAVSVRAADTPAPTINAATTPTVNNSGYDAAGNYMGVPGATGVNQGLALDISEAVGGINAFSGLTPLNSMGGNITRWMGLYPGATDAQKAYAAQLTGGTYNPTTKTWTSKSGETWSEAQTKPLTPTTPTTPRTPITPGPYPVVPTYPGGTTTKVPTFDISSTGIKDLGAKTYDWGKLTDAAPNMDWADEYSSLWKKDGLKKFLEGIIASKHTGSSFDPALGGLPAGLIKRLFEYYNSQNPNDQMFAPSLSANEHAPSVYGMGPQQAQFDTINPLAKMLADLRAQEAQPKKNGGVIQPMKKGGALNQMRQQKPAGGQDDVVKALLAPGEYVFDAEIVSALGDGSTEAGAKKLDQFRKNIRKHKRTGGLSSIPPRAKPVEKYLKG